MIFHNSLCQQFQEEIELKRLYQQAPSARILNQIAQNLTHLNLLDSSLNTSRKALILAENEKNQAEISDTHLNLAIILQKRGRYFEATNEYENAIKTAHNNEALAMAYHLLSTCYKDQKLLEKSDETNNKAIEIARKHNYKVIWAKCLNTRGLTIFRQEDYYKKALETFHEALKVAEQTNDDNIKSVINKNIGWVHLLWYEEEIGLGYINKAIDIQLRSDRSEVRQNLFYSYMVLIHFYNLVKKDYQLSNLYCLKALAIAQKYGWVEETAGVYHYFYLNFKALNQPTKALEYHEKYQAVLEKLNEDMALTQKAIIEEKSKTTSLEFENLRKENERNWLVFTILILSVGSFLIFRLYYLNRKKNKVIEEVNQNLEKKVEIRTQELQTAYNEIKDAMMRGQTLERKRVAADLHDNLGSFLSAIVLSTETLDESKLSDSEKKIFENIKSQIKEAYEDVRLFSHNLQPTELEKEGLYNALEILAQKINSLNKIHLELDLESLTPKPQNVEFNLYSICLEAINNILKHSNATHAKIAFEQGHGGLIMRISDNGAGLKSNDSGGTGFKNIQSRVEQLGGELKINSDEKGVVLEVRI
jgi:signal transduction histidine kinase